MYRIKEINHFGSKKLVIQKLHWFTWKTLLDKRGYPTVYNTTKGANVYLKYLKNEEKSIFQNILCCSSNNKYKIP